MPRIGSKTTLVELAALVSQALERERNGSSVKPGAFQGT